MTHFSAAALIICRRISLTASNIDVAQLAFMVGKGIRFYFYCITYSLDKYNGTQCKISINPSSHHFSRRIVAHPLFLIRDGRRKA